MDYGLVGDFGVCVLRFVEEEFNFEFDFVIILFYNMVVLIVLECF